MSQLPPFDPAMSIEMRRTNMTAMVQKTAGVVHPDVIAEDRTIGASIPARLFRLRDSSPVGVVLYFHGGGFNRGSIETHHVLVSHIAAAANAAVLSINYRLAPEHPFPAGVEDSYAATAWAQENHQQLGAAGKQIAIAGDSAGANFAAAVSLMARERRGPRISCQLLICPVLSFVEELKGDFSTFQRFADFQLADFDFARKLYLPNRADWEHPHASPLSAKDDTGLPPTLMQVAECDVFRDQAHEYGLRLRRAGVDAQVTEYHGMMHDFPAFGTFFPQPMRQATDEAGKFLSAHLAT